MMLNLIEKVIQLLEFPHHYVKKGELQKPLFLAA
jgi:hypothetical protein